MVNGEEQLAFNLSSVCPWPLLMKIGLTKRFPLTTEALETVHYPAYSLICLLKLSAMKQMTEGPFSAHSVQGSPLREISFYGGRLETIILLYNMLTLYGKSGH